MSRYPAALTLTVTLMLAAACSESPSSPAPELGFQAAKPASGVTAADVLLGDAGYDATDPSILSSTCPGAVGTHWHVNFGHTGCLIVSPAWSSTTYEPYDLTDDVKLIVTREKGKNGRITHVKLLAQDVIGEEGIAHETDDVPVAIPVAPSNKGFTLHVHAAAIPVWRLSGHTGGDRVAVIGTITIGDIIYR
ncbi:MAG TPA: hypothetical protein VMN60_01070 [Longimicrobiales bacterium]|nr:hypothetical protein [Longimicrobiales bacterium]